MARRLPTFAAVRRSNAPRPHGIKRDGHVGLVEAISDFHARIGQVVPGQGGFFLHQQGSAFDHLARLPVSGYFIQKLQTLRRATTLLRARDIGLIVHHLEL